MELERDVIKTSKALSQTVGNAAFSSSFQSEHDAQGGTRMRFLCLYTADQLAQPSPEHMAEMGKYVEQQFKAGRLVDTGGLKRRDKDGFSVRRKGRDYTVTQSGA